MEDATVVAINTGNDFKICRVDQVQKLHVKSVSLDGEMAFRIAYQEASKSFGIITTRAGDKDTSYFRVLDRQSLEGLIGVLTVSSY